MLWKNNKSGTGFGLQWVIEMWGKAHVRRRGNNRSGRAPGADRGPPGQEERSAWLVGRGEHEAIRSGELWEVHLYPVWEIVVKASFFYCRWDENP